MKIISDNTLVNLKILRDSLNKKSKEFNKIVKIGRTHLMDATPITLGQEFSGYVAQIDNGIKSISNAMDHLSELPIGGTAVGTELNTPKGYSKKVIEYIDFASKHDFDGLLVEGWNEGWYPEWCCTGNGIPFSFTKSLDDFNFDRISKYSKDKEISIVGHHETGGQIENYENQLEEAFKLYQKMGVKYIKTVYVKDVSKNIKQHKIKLFLTNTKP